jgi:hypothetical protein
VLTGPRRTELCALDSIAAEAENLLGHDTEM